MKVKKRIGLLLVLVLMLAGCAATEETAPQTQLPTESAVPETEFVPVEGDGEMSPPAEEILNPVDNPVVYFSMTMAENLEEVRYLVAYEDQGQTYVEYMGQEKKLGYFPAEFLHRLAEQVELSGIRELDGISEYAEGEIQASVYISFQDGSYISAEVSGNIPEKMEQAYRQMNDWFEMQTAHLEVYVPSPMISGEVDALLRDEIMEILNTSGIRELDLLAISDIPADDYFVFTAGLSSDEGILRGAQCSAAMMTTPYAFTVVRLRQDGDGTAVAEDFRGNLNWHKWVCVMPTDALIARKGDMVLCLMGTDVLYELTVKGIENSGWEILEKLQNHDA